MSKMLVVTSIILMAPLVASLEANAGSLTDRQKVEIIKELREFVREYENKIASTVEFAGADAARFQQIQDWLQNLDRLSWANADEDDDFDGYYGGWPTQASTVVRDGKKVRLLKRPSRGNPDYDRYLKLMSEKGYPTCSSSQLLCNPLLFGPGLCVSIRTRSDQQSAYRNCEKAFSKAGRTDEQVVQFLNENKKDIDSDFAKAVAESQAICTSKSVVTRAVSTCRKIAKRFDSLNQALGKRTTSEPRVATVTAPADGTRVTQPDLNPAETKTAETKTASDIPEVVPASNEKKEKQAYTSSDLDRDCDIQSKLASAKREKLPPKKAAQPGSIDRSADESASARAELSKCADRPSGESVFNNRYQEKPIQNPTGYCLRMQDPDTQNSKWIIAPQADEARVVGDLFVSVSKGKVAAYLLDDIRDTDPKRRKPLPYDLEIQKGASLASLAGQSVFVAYNKATETTQVFAANEGAISVVADLGGGVGGVAIAPGASKNNFRVAFQLSQGDFGRGKANRQTSDIVVADYSLVKDSSGSLSARQTQVARVTTERDPGAKNTDPRFNSDGSLSFEHTEVANKNRERVTVNSSDIDFKRSVEAIAQDPTCKNVPVFEASVALGYLWANLCVKQAPGELFGSKLSAEEASFYALTLDREKCHEFAKKWNDSSALIMSMSQKLFDPKAGKHLTEDAVKGLTSDRLKAACDQITK